MPETTLLQLGLLGSVFIVALLYSSVGHGGASGYLAILSLFAIDPKSASTSALVLNILVAGTAWFSFAKAKHFHWRLVFPFIVGSVPAAFVGGMLKVSTPMLNILLALTLCYASVVMMFPRFKDLPGVESRHEFMISLGVGVVLGLLSGVVGVGGGIFLSPLLIMCRWASVHESAAASAGFIVVNSIAGLSGRLLSGFSIGADITSLIVFAFVGGIIGSYLGSRRFKAVWLRRLLSVVLFVAAAKLVMKLVT
ncbi:MAG: sulfite exporter TauE/SafE family protein [Planctomycetes bacterium]|nr:sulfite exporter TauE/SafE family protein [Planctomycetota bacterium]